MRVGEVIGDDVSESAIQRIQIRETIKSHLKKERLLFMRGIKALSLFFIDEVANYKSYDEAGEKNLSALVRNCREDFLALCEGEMDLLEKP